MAGLSKEQLEDAASKSIYLFLEVYQVSNDQGQLLDFKDHPYLWDIYGDFTPHQAILKAAQVGFSTTANLKAFWLAKYKNIDIIYSLPSASDIKDFVGGKTNRLIANNSVLQSWTVDKDSIEQKQVGTNIIYFRGTWTERAAIAIPADLYISDETDRSKQDIVQQYKTRLQHSKYAWEWYFSNPSAAGVGVDKHWAESDQKHWFVLCECGHEWYLTMENIMWPKEHSPDNLSCKECLHKPYFGCLRCLRELNRRKGRWVAKFKGKPISGYWIPSLIVPAKSASDILKLQTEYTEEQFTNFVLGLPYVGKGNKLTRPMFMQNLITDRVNPREKRTIIGVDTGIGINYVMGNEDGLFFFDRTESYEPLKRLMRQDKTAIMVIDQGGDIIGPREMREEFKNRVFLCYFRQDRKNDQIITWNDEDGTVVADRNKLLQLVIDELIQKRIPIFGSEADWEDVWQEFGGMYRTQEESTLGTPVFKWNKPASGRCDYPFAVAYLRIGLDRYMNDKATFHGASTEFAFRGMESKY